MIAMAQQFIEQAQQEAEEKAREMTTVARSEPVRSSPRRAVAPRTR